MDECALGLMTIGSEFGCGGSKATDPASASEGTAKPSPGYSITPAAFRRIRQKNLDNARGNQVVTPWDEVI